MEPPLPLGQISICARCKESLWYDSGAFSTWNPGIRALSSGRSFRLRSPTMAVCTQDTSYCLLRCRDITYCHATTLHLTYFIHQATTEPKTPNSCGSCYHHFPKLVSLPKYVGQQPMLTQPVQLEHNSTQQINYLNGIQHPEPVDPLTIT